MKDEDPSAVVHHTSESNISLVKASFEPAGVALSGSKGKHQAMVVLSEQRRRQLSGNSGKHHLEPIQASKEPADQSDDLSASSTIPETTNDMNGNLQPAPPSTRGNTATNASSPTRTSRPNASLAASRVKLHDAFLDKYGSMRAVFRAFDKDGNGMISAQRFTDMVEAAEVDLVAEDVRSLYNTADVNGDNTVAFDEFVQLFASEEAASSSRPSACSPVRQPPNLVADPSSSLALKYRTPLELSPRSRRRMKQLRVQVMDELSKKHGEALSVHGGKHDLLLAYAFKNLDNDNDGLLSYDQVERALGPDFLQLDIPTTAMAEMVHLMDRNCDRQISLREFVHYFAAGAREPPTDLIDNARSKQLAALYTKMTAALTPREEVDVRYAAARNAAPSPVVDPPEPDLQAAGCMQQQLLARTAAELAKSPVHRGSGASRSTAMARHSMSDFGDGSSSSGPVVAPAVSPVSQDRFHYRRRERTDWTRVGVGGDGTRGDSGLFLSSPDRFTTTSASTYSPISRAPPTPGGGVVLVREGVVPIATAEHTANQQRRVARFERTQALLEDMSNERVAEARLADWRGRARVRRTAGERFAYLDALQEQEARLAAREQHMQKRYGGAASLRMWAGSADSQFNS